MAITLTGTGGLFTCFGKLGKLLYAVNGDQSAYASIFGEIAAQYASTLKDRYGALATREVSLVRGQSGIVSAVQQLAQQTVLDMVEADQPAAARNLTDALVEVRRQMLAAGATIQASTVGVTIAALGSPVGSGAFVYSTKRGDGLVQENAIPETGRLVCTADSYADGLTAGRERFSYVGESGLGAGVFDYDWPAGSDANQPLTAISADENANTTGNLLTNGNFEVWNTTGTPTLDGTGGSAWVATGTAGTDFARNGTSPFRGTYDFEFKAGTGANTAIAVTFGSATGTTAALKPLTSYAVNLLAKRTGSVSAGVITVELVDGSNTVIADAQSVNNSFTQSCSALTTSYAAVSGVFRTPAQLPATIKLRIRMSTALTDNPVRIDDVCLTPLAAPTLGGPGYAVFGGATPFLKGDTWTAEVTNDRGGAIYGATFQTLLDRFFSTRQLGLLFPSSGSPTIADTLITA